MRWGLLAIAFLLLAGVALWQRSQINTLRGNVAALEAEHTDETSTPAHVLAALRALPAVLMHTPSADESRASERSLILSQYRDLLSGVNLAPDRLARLEALLTDRVETVIDVEEAAFRQGYSQGSAESNGAVLSATWAMNQEIAQLLYRPPPAPAVTAPPAAPPEVASAPAPVNVFLPSVSQEVAVAPAPVPDVAGTPLYSPYWSYPMTTVFVGRNPARSALFGREIALRPPSRQYERPVRRHP